MAIAKELGRVNTGVTLAIAGGVLIDEYRYGGLDALRKEGPIQVGLASPHGVMISLTPQLRPSIRITPTGTPNA